MFVFYICYSSNQVWSIDKGNFSHHCFSVLFEAKCTSLRHQILSYEILCYLPLLLLTGYRDVESFEPSVNAYLGNQVSKCILASITFSILSAYSMAEQIGFHG